MGLETNTGDLIKEYSQMRVEPVLSAEVIKKDSDVLESLKGSETHQLVEGITTHLEKENRPGSADYIMLFSQSAVLDKQLRLLESGTYDPAKIEQEGFKPMIDSHNTTPEMISAGQAVLTEEARTDLLATINQLKSQIDQHVLKTTRKASEYYGAQLSHKPSVVERIQGIFGVKAEPYDIPLQLNDSEFQKLQELYAHKFTSMDEARETFQRELGHMMRQRPGMIGLDFAASTSHYIGEMTEDLGGIVEGPIDIGKLRRLHEIMNGKSMEELQIYPEFGKAIEEAVERDLS